MYINLGRWDAHKPREPCSTMKTKSHKSLRESLHKLLFQAGVTVRMKFPCPTHPFLSLFNFRWEMVGGLRTKNQGASPWWEKGGRRGDEEQTHEANAHTHFYTCKKCNMAKHSTPWAVHIPKSSCCRWATRAGTTCCIIQLSWTRQLHKGQHWILSEKQSPWFQNNFKQAGYSFPRT